MRKLVAVAGPIFLALLSGCTVVHVPESVTTVSADVIVRNGSVHGGQQPVSGATVQLWQVGTTGYGQGATPLGTPATSFPDGSFNITGNYTCPDNNPLVYITATSGNPGSSGNNYQLLMMTVLGYCGNLHSNTFISINEVTTVAAAYALAQFMDPLGNIGSYGYSNSGLTNAFIAVDNLVNKTSGLALATTPFGNGVVPQMEINMIANILSSCVNTVSVSGGPSQRCSDLFTATMPTGPGAVGAVKPANTLAVARNMALYPWYNAGPSSTIFPFSGVQVAFATSISTAPNDWTMALSFNGGGSKAVSVALDSGGNVWTANYGAGNGGGSLSKLNAFGVPQPNSPFTFGVNGPVAIAIDTNDEPWVVNHDVNQVMEFKNDGTTIAGPFNFGSETNNPEAIAVDGNNNVWIANTGTASGPGAGPSSITEFNGPSYPSNGQTISPTGGFTSGGINSAISIAIDGSNSAWIADLQTNGLTKIDQSGAATGPFTTAPNVMVHPIGVAVDGGGNVWAPSAAALTLTESNSGGALTSYAVTGPGAASAVAVDGSNRVYVLKRTSPSPTLAVFNSSGVQITNTTNGAANGYTGGNMSGPDTMAIDGSGNVWIGNQAPVTVNGVPQTVTEFIGLATPTITPLSQAVEMQQVGLPPGTPIPVTVLSTFLPFYSTAVAYDTQLTAEGGNTGTFTWTLNSSGALPSGFSLLSDGEITNATPSASATATFTVKACDVGGPTNCAVSGPLTLIPSSSLPVGGSEGLMTGRYVIRFNGYNNFFGGNGTERGFDELMSLNFNGAGSITAGEYDFNNPGNHTPGVVPVSGSYTIGADHRGIMVLNVNGNAFNFAFSVGNINVSNIAQDIHLIEFDDTLASGGGRTGTGTGVGKLQTATAVAPNQSFIFGMDGETPCVFVSNNGVGNGCPNGVFAPFGYVAAVGRFTIDSTGTITGVADEGANNSSYNGITLTGTATASDSAGRGTFTLVQNGTTFPKTPTSYVYYVVSPTEMYVMSTDTHANFTMLNGDVVAQTATFTSASTLIGNFVAYESSPSGGNGTNSYPTTSNADLIYISSTGSSLTGSQDHNHGGNVQFNKTIGDNPYTFDSNGRLTLAPNGNGVPVFYFANASQGFAIEQPSSATDNQGDTGLISIEAQTGGSFSCTTNSGLFALGNYRQPTVTGVTNGTLVKDGTTGAVAATIDNSDPSGVLSYGQQDSLTCAADGNTSTTGRLTYSDSNGDLNVGYYISPTKQVVINATQGESNPSLLIIQK